MNEIKTSLITGAGRDPEAVRRALGDSERRRGLDGVPRRASWRSRAVAPTRIMTHIAMQEAAAPEHP